MSQEKQRIVELREIIINIKNDLERSYESCMSKIDDAISYYENEHSESFDPIAGSTGNGNASRFYANNSENSVPAFSDGPYAATGDDNHSLSRRSIPYFTNTYQMS